MDNSRFHTPTFGRMDVPDGFAACVWCGQFITLDQLVEESCPKRREKEEE